MKKKIYLADIFREAADKHLRSCQPGPIRQWKSESAYSCCAIVKVLTKGSPRFVEYTKSRITSQQRKNLPEIYDVLDWVRKFGVPVGSGQAFKGAYPATEESQGFRFMLLEMMALVAEDEKAFVEADDTI